MKILSVHIQNYKSFLDTDEVRFETGINIITGRNNVGKSSLLEALELDISNKPHRSISSINTKQRPCLVRLCVRVPFKEFNQYFTPPAETNFTITVSGSDRAARTMAETYISKGYIDFYINYQANNQHRTSMIPELESKITDRVFVKYKTDSQGELRYETTSINDPSGASLLDHIWGYGRRQVYRFKAERFHVGIHDFGAKDVLERDASNLPMVLNYLLSTNPEKFKRYSRLVNRVFPEIKAITTRPLPNNKVEILVWSHDLTSEREDLAVPLVESGTGISQVLAMLYILVTASESKTLIIDEPNSFLHPGAIRALMSIFQEHTNHQYIISTHSPSIVANSNPSVIHLLKKDSSMKTQIEQIDRDKSHDLRNCLIELGAGLSEVFGAEGVLWVEGRTEEICFPLILDRLKGQTLGSVTIAGVKSTSDFERKNVRHTFEIYERLTKSTALVPPAVGYIFDREERSEQEIDAIKSHMDRRVSFLARRCYENYLLLPGAIQFVLANTKTFNGTEPGLEKIELWLRDNGAKYAKGLDRSTHPSEWLAQVNASKLLSALFSELSGNREYYNKTIHSVQLTEWILKNCPSELAEVSVLISNLLS